MLLEEKRYLLLAAAIGFGAIYVIRFWGINFAKTDNLKGFLVNAYTWSTCLALCGCGRKWFNKETSFTQYMRDRSFGFYLIHNPLIVWIAYGIDVLLHPKTIWYYVLEIILLSISMPLLYEILSRIPAIKKLLLAK